MKADPKIDITWEPFSVDGHIFPHAALLLPAKLNGVDCFVQLDTGINENFISKSNGVAISNYKTSELIVAGIKEQVKVSVGVIKSMADNVEPQLIGSIGNGLFQKGTVEINIKKNYFAYSDHSLLLNDVNSENFTYFFQNGQDTGHVLLPFKLFETENKNVIFDTGASLFGLVFFERHNFDKLSEAEIMHFRVSSFSQKIECVMGKSSKDGTFGKLIIRNISVGYCEKDLSGMGGNIIGVLGLSAFGNGTIWVDYLSKKWKFIND